MKLSELFYLFLLLIDNSELKIIFQLIKINKFDKYEQIHKFIIEELELESINITKKMFDILYHKILNIENEKIKKILYLLK